MVVLKFPAFFFFFNKNGFGEAALCCAVRCCAVRWTVGLRAQSWGERERETERERERERVWGGSCVRGSHNAERHLANKGSNNNSAEGLRPRGLPLRTRHTGAQRDATTKRRGLALANIKNFVYHACHGAVPAPAPPCPLRELIVCTRLTRDSSTNRCIIASVSFPFFFFPKMFPLDQNFLMSIREGVKTADSVNSVFSGRAWKNGRTFFFLFFF